MAPDPLNVEHELPAHQERPDEEKAGAQAPGGVPDATAKAAELDQTKAERDSLVDRMARMQAEFENARKRAAREQREFKNFAVADVVRSLLPALDSFDAALEAPAQSLEEFRGGVELIRRQLHEILGKAGLRQIPAKGEPFDPRLHQAIEMVDTSNAQDNQVVEELQPGYKLEDRLLRPAMVRVARNRKQ